MTNSRLYPPHGPYANWPKPPAKYLVPNGTRVEVTCEGKTFRGYVCARGGAADPHQPEYTLWVTPFPITGVFPEPGARGYPLECVRILSVLELVAEAAA